jgi:outer membrane protein TolC
LNQPAFLNNFQSLVSGDQTLYDAGKTKRAVRTAKLGEDVSREDGRRSQLEVIAQVVRFYWNTQLGAEEVNVTAQALRSAEADLERSEARRASGMATDADVLSIRVHLAGVREEQIWRSADIEVARAEMNDAIGLPLDSAHSLTTPLAPLPVTQTELSGDEKNAVPRLITGGGHFSRPGDRAHGRRDCFSPAFAHDRSGPVLSAQQTRIPRQ